MPQVVDFVKFSLAVEIEEERKAKKKRNWCEKENENVITIVMVMYMASISIVSAIVIRIFILNSKYFRNLCRSYTKHSHSLPLYN